MKIFRKQVKDNGRITYALFGIRIFSYRQKFLSVTDLQACRNRLKKTEHRIRKQLAQGRRLRVAFLVGFASMFPARPLMERLLQDARFEVTLVILPDLRFGIPRAHDIQAQAIRDLSPFAQNTLVIPVEEKTPFELKTIADIVFPPTPYDLSHPSFHLLHLVESGILPAMINYGFFRSVYDRSLISDPRYGLYWKVFAETAANLREYRTYAALADANVVLTGYCKMDAYRELPATSPRKTILIAPHHSLEGGFNKTMSLSTFDRYADFYLELPQMYPQLHFIFRPHPALFVFLAHEDQWGETKVAAYRQQMTSMANVTWSDGGDYFNEFARSDALIDDCGSYLVEYFYTKKPQCYLLKDPSDSETKFTALGQECLQNCYLAYSQDEILHFINTVVVAGTDPKQADRIRFSESEIMLNYPNVSDIIINHIETVFRIKELPR